MKDRKVQVDVIHQYGYSFLLLKTTNIRNGEYKAIDEC